MSTFKKSTQTAALKYLANDQYFSRGNKQFFNVLETHVYEFNDRAVLIMEKQGGFISDGRKHNTLKISARNKHAMTLTSGFAPEINGEILLYNLRQFFKNNLGYFENRVMNELVSITEARDYKNTLLFEAEDNTGFYLTIDRNDIKIVLHK